MKTSKISRENANFFIEWINELTKIKPYAKPISDLKENTQKVGYFFTKEKFAQAYISLCYIRNRKHSLIFKDLAEMMNNAIISEQKIPKINFKNLKITKIEKAYLKQFYNEFQEIFK